MQDEPTRHIADAIIAGSDDDQFIRLECLRIAVSLVPPGVGLTAAKDAALSAAKEIEAYVRGIRTH